MKRRKNRCNVIPQKCESIHMVVLHYSFCMCHINEEVARMHVLRFRLVAPIGVDVVFFFFFGEASWDQFIIESICDKRE